MRRKREKKLRFGIGVYLAGSIAVVTGLAIVMPKLLDYLAEQMEKSSASAAQGGGTGSKAVRSKADKAGAGKAGSREKD